MTTGHTGFVPARLMEDRFNGTTSFIHVAKAVDPSGPRVLSAMSRDCSLLVRLGHSLRVWKK